MLKLHFIIGFRRISGTPHQLFLVASSRKSLLFCCLSEHSCCSIQTRIRLYNLGLQAHDEKCSGHRFEYSLSVITKRKWTARCSPKLLSNVLHRHSSTHVQVRIMPKHPLHSQFFLKTTWIDISYHILFILSEAELYRLFSVVTDTSHTAGLTMHATILTYMFTLVETNKVTVALNPAAASQADTTPATISAGNISYVQDFVANLLRTAFPHLSDNQIKITVQGLFNLDQDIPAFKEHLRDFLVQIREFTGEDDSDLFLEEREQSLKVAQEEKRKIQISVPGMLNPHEVPEDMQEM